MTYTTKHHTPTRVWARMLRPLCGCGTTTPNQPPHHHPLRPRTPGGAGRCGTPHPPQGPGTAGRKATIEEETPTHPPGHQPRGRHTVTGFPTTPQTGVEER